MAMKNDNLNKKNLYCRDARANEIINILGRSPFTQGKGYHIRKFSLFDFKILKEVYTFVFYCVCF